jgi:carboxymethylenebutenolidase
MSMSVGNRIVKATLAALVLTAAPWTAATAASPGYAPMENPVGPGSGWWDPAWWEEGQIPEPANHPVTTRWVEYPAEDAEVPALVARPAGDQGHPAVLFVHGRRGLDDLLQLQVRRIAARGFVVLAPDLYSGRFISKLPIEHDYILEEDTARAVDVLLALPGVSTRRACVVSHTRGGYYALKALTTHGRQDDAIACYVSYYPHLQDPNAPEPMQVYRYATEADQLTVPVLVFLGEHEQYQRRRSAETAIRSLQDDGKDATLVVYPGVGRGFDFRPPHVRTFADDLAAKDAIQRTARFVRRHLAPYGK